MCVSGKQSAKGDMQETQARIHHCGGCNVMSCMEPGHLLSNIYVHEALEFCPFLPLFLAFSMAFPRALRAVRVSSVWAFSSTCRQFNNSFQ